MFEHFTHPARMAIADAHAEARRLEHRIGSDHLLVAFFGRGGGAGLALRRVGLDRDTVREALVALRPARAQVDPDQALATIGIDAPKVRERVAASFGPGAIRPPSPFGGDSMDVLTRIAEQIGSGRTPIDTVDLLREIVCSRRSAMR